MPPYLAALLAMIICIAASIIVVWAIEPKVNVLFKKFWECLIEKSKALHIYPILFGVFIKE
jgi:hypothetical protein